MLNAYIAQQKIAQSIENDNERLTHGTCILRSLLQIAAITSLEILIKKTPFPENNEQVVTLANRFFNPPDSLPIEILDASTPTIRSLVSDSFNLGWYKGDKASKPNLVASLQEWLAFRNNKLAHGALSTEDIKEWAPKTLAIIDHCLKCFSDFLPQTNNNELVTNIDSDSLLITTPLVYENHLIIIKKVVNRKGIWQIEVQTLNRERSFQGTVDLPRNSVFETINSNNKDRFSLREVSFNGKSSSIFSNVPARQTNTFVGREKEVASLTEWINDEEDTKYCLIYGDGGIGKTTLALEFLRAC